MKYFVSIGARTVVVELDGDCVRVDGQPGLASLESQAGSPEVRLVLNGRGTMLAVEGHRDGVWQLVDRGSVRDVGVEDERSRHIRALAGSGGAASTGGVIRAPMPGRVVRIPVTIGDHVPVGSGLLVLEAMKMENEIRSATAGVVTAVLVTAGQAVEKGQILVELGPVT
jgi:pyruvate carboxylase subunit B